MNKPDLPSDSVSVARAERTLHPFVGRLLGRGRFSIVRALGSGGMGAVYEAHDEVRGHSVALKYLWRAPSAGGFELKAEFRSLAGLEHPNVVRLYELICDEDPWFFTMELVQGVDLVHYVRGTSARLSNAITKPSVESGAEPQLPEHTGTVSVERLCSVLVQLVAGLQVIHAAGKLHCDIKPSNVLVAQDGRVVILDFGLVTDSDSDTRSARIAGTPGYIAPERFAGQRATEASDWYAAGVVLHESLTGELPSPSHSRERPRTLPFPDRSASEREQLDRIAEICAGLLDPDPQRRWNGDQVLARLDPSTRLRPSAPLGGGTARTSQFVGREAELTRLHDSLTTVRGGAPAAVCIGGESGIGKTALIAQFVAQARGMPKALVIQSRCYERESVRYKTLDGLMDQLCAFWARLPEAQAAAIMPRGVSSLACVFEVLHRVAAVKALPTSTQAFEAPDPAERRLAAFRALKELLARIADRYLLIIVIDDLQWGDAESAEVLVQLLSPPEAPSLLLVGAYRSTDVRESACLDQLLRALRRSPIAYQDLTVSALSAPQAATLAASLSAQQLSDATLSRITEESKGNPFFVAELVRHTGKQGELGAVHTGDLVYRRTTELPASDRHLLQLIAVAPGPIEQRVLREASGFAPEYDASIRNLLSESLVRSRRGDAYDLLEPYHDRIREAIVAHLPPALKRVHHQTFARVLLNAHGTAHQAAAVHLEGCGELAAASRSYLQAAERARDALAFDHAAQLYEKAITLSSDQRASAELRVRLAEALALAGHGPRSAEAYLAAAADAGDPLRDELSLRAAEQLLYAGHHEPATELLRGLLPKQGVSLPRGPRWLVLLQVLYNALWVFYTMLRPPRASRRPAESARRAQVCETLGDGLLYVNFAVFARLQQQHVLAGLKAAEPGRVALALTSRALLLASPMPHLFHRVLPDLDRAVELARRSNDAYIQGRVLLNRAVVYSAAGRYAETNSLAQQAEQVFRRDCQGVKWGLQHAIAWQSVSLFFLGRFRELDLLCREHLPEARRRGDEMLTKLLAIWSAWVAVTRDEPDKALSLAPVSPDEVPGRAFTVLDAGALSQRGPLLLYLGRVDEAWTLFSRCQARVAATGVLTARARANDFYWTRGLVATHLLARGATSPGRSRVERQLRHDLRSLRSSRTDDAAAMANHLEGNLLLAQGRRSLAIEKLGAAARHYGAFDMRAWEQTMRLAVAQLEGPAAARNEVGRAKQSLKECGIDHPERWLALWCPGVAHDGAASQTA